MTFIASSAFLPPSCAGTCQQQLRPPLLLRNKDSPFWLQSPPSPKIRSIGGLQLLEDPNAATVFEPVVNVPALGSFVVIASVFTFLLLRVNAVDRAAERRKAALKELRGVKSRELSSEGDERPDSDAVQRAVREYEVALQEEEQLRTLIPGVRIVAPNGPASSSSENIMAAKQFLGVDLQQEQPEEAGGAEEKKRLSSGAVAVLAVVALSQLALLYMLSFDPMVATFSGVDSMQPLSGLPVSSW